MERKVISFTVDKGSDNKTLKEFLKLKCGLSSRMITLLKKEDAGITRDGRLIRTVDTVKCGERIDISLPKDTNDISAVDAPLSVIYEDDYLLIVDKPPLMPVHPTKVHQSDTLANIVSSYMIKRGEYYTFRALNRLDRDTSGLVVIAKDRISAYALSKNIKKTYFAVCEGIISEEGTISSPIKVEEGRSIQRVVSSDGMKAVTHYRPVCVKDSNTLLKISLETGRTHQIRCHLSSIGHPLCGDDMYGGHLDLIKRQALHCGIISFKGPFCDDLKTVKCDLPNDMKLITDYDAYHDLINN